MQPKVDHKDIVVVKNKFYPSGLTQQDVWEYYQKVKRLIVNEVKYREVMIMFAVRANEFVVKRKLSNNRPITITSQNYDKIISGRTVSLHTAMRNFEDFGIIDVDCDIFSLAKRATYDVATHFVNETGVKKVLVYFTGKESFHVKIMLHRAMSITNIRDFLRSSILKSDLSRKYTVLHKRHVHIPNLDLCIDKYRGNFIVPNALSIWGLKSVQVPVSRISEFKKESTKIGR